MSIPIVIFYGGQWNGYNVYENSSVVGILVDVQINFNCLVGLIYEEIQLDGLVELSVLLDFGKSNVQTFDHLNASISLFLHSTKFLSVHTKVRIV